MNIGWNLGNTLDAYDTNRFTSSKGHNNPADIETCWGNPVPTKAMIDDIKAQGFNAVRVPVTWDFEIDDNDGYKVNEAWMARVKEVVDYVMDNDLYCILNVHHDTGEQGWLKAGDGLTVHVDEIGTLCVSVSE